jgi:ankyrin repeat protein
MKRLVILLFWLIACVAAPHEESPLILAARAGDVAAVRRLAAGGHANDAGGVNGWPVLMHAIHKNQLGSVAALLDAGADPNRANPRGLTPLMMAASYGRADMVKLLMQRGADPRTTDRDNETALDYALAGSLDIDELTVFSCQDSTVRALLAGGAPPHAQLGRIRAAKLKRCESASLVR